MSRPRVALYGHDTLGLGHLRRNLALAATLSELRCDPDVLVVTGAAEGAAFPLPSGVDVLTVPGVAKDRDGRYGSRSLSLSFEAVVGIRRAVMAAALEQFAPDLLVVDKVPLGLAGELAPALRSLRARRHTRVVLGLRDVLDDPVVAREEWRTGRMTEGVREFFDEIWVYGDPSVHDVIEACGVPPALRRIVRFAGYLANGCVAASARPPVVPAGTGYVLCMVGGGLDGVELATAFAGARMPPGVVGIVATGPQMSAVDHADVAARAAVRPDLVVVAFRPDIATWVARAEAIVTMGGYNSVAEVLATEVPALVVPRRRPRVEQFVRARALAAAGHIDVLPGVTPDADRLGRWLFDAVRRPRVARCGIDLDGLSRVRDFAAHLLEPELFDAVAV
jgi:predicted glycosyltransferase